MYVPHDNCAENKHPALAFSDGFLMDSSGRFGHASTPKTTFPSSSRPNAIAYWSPLRKLHPKIFAVY